MGATRMVIDGVEGFRDSALRVERFGLFLNALLHQLREAGITTLVMEEMPLHSDHGHSRTTRVSALTENLVLLRYAGDGRDCGARSPSSSSAKAHMIRPPHELVISSQGLDVIESPLSATVSSAIRLCPRRCSRGDRRSPMKTILVVDDEFDILTVWRLLLERHGFMRY